MTRLPGIALLTLVVVTTISAAFDPAPVPREPPSPKDAAIVTTLEGLWKVEARQAGNFIAGNRSTYIRIQNDSWAYVYSFNGVETQGPWYELHLDPKQAPAAIDLKNPSVGNKKRISDEATMKGIVKVEGDTLTFCYVFGGKGERPRGFELSPNRNILKGAPNPSPAVHKMILKKVK